jgi:hypothetical protein
LLVVVVLLLLLRSSQCGCTGELQRQVTNPLLNREYRIFVMQLP